MVQLEKFWGPTVAAGWGRLVRWVTVALHGKGLRKLWFLEGQE